MLDGCTNKTKAQIIDKLYIPNDTVKVYFQEFIIKPNDSVYTVWQKGYAVRKREWVSGKNCYDCKSIEPISVEYYLYSDKKTHCRNKVILAVTI